MFTTRLKNGYGYRTTVPVISITILFFLQGARELVGTTYNFNLATMSINVSIIAVFGFLSPAVLFFIRGRTMGLMTAFAIILGISRVGLSLGLDAGLHLASSFLVVSSSLMFLVLVFHNIPGDIKKDDVAAATVQALLMAAILDVALRGAGGSFDVSTHGFMGLRSLSLIFSLPLVIYFLFGIRKLGSFEERQASGTARSPLFGIGAGLFLFLYMALLGFPNVMAGWTSSGPAFSHIIASVSLLVLVLLFSLAREAVRKDLVNMGSQAVLAITFLILFIDPASPASGILLPASIIPLTIIFYHNLAGSLEPNAEGNAIPLNLFLAGFIFVLLALMSVLTLTWAHVPGTAFMKDKMPALALLAALAFTALSRLGNRLPNDRRTSGDGAAARTSRPFVVFCAVVLLLGAVVPVSSSDFVRPISDAGPGEMRVMTYNIHQGYGMDGLIDPWEILGTIKSANPDILVLQESETNRLSSKNVDILNWLAVKLGMHAYSGPPAGEQIYGLALLSKYPIIDGEQYYLESVEDQRVLFRCLVDSGVGEVAVYGIHMGLSREDRTSQSNEVLGILENETMPFILAGDFNTWPNETIYQNLTGAAHDAWVLAGHETNGPGTYTFDSLAPRERIDYIFVSDELAPLVASCEVMYGQEGSDHLPVWAALGTD